MKTTFQTVALIGKYKSPEIVESLLRVGEFLVARGLTVLVDTLTAQHLPQPSYRMLPLDELGGLVDLAIVLGGDGTMLNIARTLAPHKVPLVGVNQGRLGFLTDVSLDTMQQTLGGILDGQYVTDQRTLLAARVLRDGEEIFQTLAFNEVVLHRGNLSSMVEFDVRIDGEYVYTQRADGVIVSSPTGSTAYALSAGGAIVHPSLELLELVPINPHTLSNRPLVVSSHAVVEIQIHRVKQVRAHFDSHSGFDLGLHDRLSVTRHATPVYLLHPVGHSYYRTLREKLLWNQSL